MSKIKKQSNLKKAMHISVIEGTYAQLYSTLTAIGSNFITKAAVILNASPIHFSLLSGIAQLCQLFQLYAVVHNRKVTSRKKPCVQFAFWGCPKWFQYNANADAGACFGGLSHTSLCNHLCRGQQHR